MVGAGSSPPGRVPDPFALVASESGTPDAGTQPRISCQAFVQAE